MKSNYLLVAYPASMHVEWFSSGTTKNNLEL
jgi:hypothetical protein